MIEYLTLLKPWIDGTWHVLVILLQALVTFQFVRILIAVNIVTEVDWRKVRDAAMALVFLYIYTFLIS